MYKSKFTGAQIDANLSKIADIEHQLTDTANDVNKAISDINDIIPHLTARFDSIATSEISASQSSLGSENFIIVYADKIRVNGALRPTGGFVAQAVDSMGITSGNYYCNWVDTDFSRSRKMFCKDAINPDMHQDKVYICNNKAYIFDKTSKKLITLN